MPGGLPTPSERGAGRPAEKPPTATRVVVGRVGKPHGLDGSFRVVDPQTSALAVGSRVIVGEEEVEIIGRKGTDAVPIVRLAMATDRTAIEALRGATLTVPRSSAPALADDEYFADDLVGCTVVAGDRSLGTVERMVAYPSCEVLVVGELLVPMVRDAIRSVDLPARRIEVDAGFLGI